MSSVMEELQALQKIDAELVHLGKRHKAGPEEVAHFEAKLSEARDARKGVEEAIRAKASEVDQCNMDIRTAEADLEDAQEKLKISKNSKEYKILTGRVKTLKQAIADGENKGLAAMEELDALRADMQEKQKAVEVAETKLDEVRQEVDREKAEIRGTLDRLKAERAAQIERVQAADADAMAVYDNALRRGRGQGMAEMVGNTCQACYRSQNANVENLVLVGRNVSACRCAGCGRILYVNKGAAAQNG